MSLSWLPNAISLLRIVLVAPILMLTINGDFAFALMLFFIAGFSDGVDGYLAKRFDWHTRFGALLDPVADKLLVDGLFITLACMQLVPIWLAAVVIARDVIILGGAAAYNFLVKPLQGEPTNISKLNTVFELLFLLFVLSRAAFDWPDEISITVLGAAILITAVISGIDYVWSWSKRARVGL